MARRTLVLAPNWLGDAVMALPALAGLRRQHSGDHLIAAARPSIAPLFEMVGGIDQVVRLPAGRAWHPADLRREAAAIASAKAELAILLTNSFRTAWIVRRAGVAERWGVRADLRGRLLTRAVPRPRRRGAHHADYYRDIVSAFGIEPARESPRVTPPPAAFETARVLLEREGVPAGAPLVGMAPGAAYGKAKQWPPRRFAELAVELHDRFGAVSVLVGSGGDREAGEGIRRCLDGAAARASLVNLIGKTDLVVLAGVIARMRAFVSNDSGAMHLAAAVGLPVAAVFGSTDERATAPLPAPARGVPAHAILTAPAWCRPCLLRECPIDHRCMTRISAAAVARAMEGWFER
ncbi:MAG: lipopolysaccharide heptosyltransferase II [Acidobacteria bacterium]|nr:lipopolysaccharide heptosyltransferase II [Acidobacteriota bacterium]